MLRHWLWRLGSFPCPDLACLACPSPPASRHRWPSYQLSRPSRTPGPESAARPFSPPTRITPSRYSTLGAAKRSPGSNLFRAQTLRGPNIPGSSLAVQGALEFVLVHLRPPGDIPPLRLFIELRPGRFPPAFLLVAVGPGSTTPLPSLGT